MRKKKRGSLASLVGRVSVCMFGLGIRVELLRAHSKEPGLFSHCTHLYGRCEVRVLVL